MKRPHLRHLAAWLALALAAAGCHEAPSLGGDWPEGTLVVARTEALARLLAQLQRIDGTRIARRAAEIEASLPDCPWVEGREEDGDPADVWSRLVCRPAQSALAGLDRERRDRDIAFALPAHEGAHGGVIRTVGALTVSENGDVAVEILLSPSAFSSARALMLSAAEPPGPPLLSHRDELAHARLRPEGGMDIAALVPASSQADRLFHLKSELFAGAVLDGTWEAAIYLPDPGRPMPPAALAVGFSLKEPAVAAIERFVSELQSAWPVHRSEFAVGAARGACLLDLNILPDLAPCYVATDAALVIGWNSASVRKALATGGDAVHAAGEPHPVAGLSVNLARFPEADARFARVVTPDAAPTGAAPPPWRRLTANGAREGDAVRVRVRLVAGAEAGA